MKKTIAIFVMAAVFVGFAFFNIAYANCGMCKPALAEEGEVINKTCPVMGGEIDKDTPYKTVHKGKTIGFCCPDCIEKFNAEPKKYMAKIYKGKKECMIKCPKCGAEIDVMKECKKGKMEGSCPMMEKAKSEKEEKDEHNH